MENVGAWSKYYIKRNVYLGCRRRDVSVTTATKKRSEISFRNFYFYTDEHFNFFFKNIRGVFITVSD